MVLLNRSLKTFIFIKEERIPMHKIKTLLIAAVLVLSIGAAIVPTGAQATGADALESTEVTEPTTPPDVSPLSDGPLVE